MENFWNSAKLLGVDSTTTTFPEWNILYVVSAKPKEPFSVPGTATY